MANKRFAFVYNDINAIDKADLKPHEVLLDYNLNDLVIIDSEGKQLYLKRYMQKILDDYAESHAEDFKAHINANNILPGFMSAEDYKNLYNNIKNTETIYELINYNLRNNKNTISDLNYTLKDNKLNISCSLLNGVFKFGIDDKELELEKNSASVTYLTNKYDLVILHFSNFNDLDYRILNNVEISNNVIIWKNITYKLNLKNYCYENIDNPDDDSLIIPLLKINKSNRIITRIYRQKLDISLDLLLKNNYIDLIMGNYHTEKVENSIITNAFEEPTKKYDDIIVNVPFNNNENEINSLFDFGKEVYYTNSFNGKMMKGAKYEGNKFRFDSINKFKFEFIINNNYISTKGEDIIILGNNDIDFIKVSIKEYNKLLLTFSNKDIVYPISYNIDTNKLYTHVTIDKFENSCNVYIDNEIIACDLAVDEKDVINSIYIPAKDTSIGNIVIGNSDVEGQTYDTNKLFNNFSLLDNKTDYVTLENCNFIPAMIQYGDNNKFSYKLNISSKNKISKNDSLELYFYNELSNDLPLIDIDAEIESLNSIRVDQKYINYFNIGDDIYIEIDNKKICNTIKYIDYESNEIVTDMNVSGNNFIIKSKYCKVYSKNICSPLEVYIGDEKINNIIIEDKYYKVIFKKDYEINQDTLIKVVFNELLHDKDNLNNINIKSSNVKFGDIPDKNTISKSFVVGDILNSVNIKNPIIKMSVNGKELENDKFLYYSDDNDIYFNLNVNIDDIIVNSYSYKVLNDLFDIECKLTFSTGSNKAIINGEEFDCNGYVIRDKIVKLKIDEDDMINLNIKTSNGNKKAKLYIESLEINLVAKEIGKISMIQSPNGRITDYIYMADKLVYDSCCTIRLMYESYIDNSKTVFSGAYRIISDTYKGYRIVQDANEILKILDENNRMYDLDANYVL